MSTGRADLIRRAVLAVALSQGTGEHMMSFAASYGLSLCAEVGVAMQLHATGGGRLVAIAVVDADGASLVPCGRCRQILSELGGPDLLVATIRADLGVEVDHYVQTDFAGALAIGDALGGVRLSFAHPVRDQQVGLALDAGCEDLGGSALLALGRSRHLQEQVDGRWHADPTADLGRIERQQAVLSALLPGIATLSARRPGQLVDVVRSALGHLTVDQRTTAGDLVDVARSIRGRRLSPLRLRVHDAVHDGASVLEWTRDDPALAAFRSGRALDAPTSEDDEGAAPRARAIVPVPC